MSPCQGFPEMEKRNYTGLVSRGLPLCGHTPGYLMSPLQGENQTEISIPVNVDSPSETACGAPLVP
jgi:hypothetical protein